MGFLTYAKRSLPSDSFNAHVSSRTKAVESRALATLTPSSLKCKLGFAFDPLAEEISRLLARAGMLRYRSLVFFLLQIRGQLLHKCQSLATVHSIRPGS